MRRPVAVFEDAIDVARPADAVFAAVSDLERVFAALGRRGDVRAERIAGAGPTAARDRWRVVSGGRFGRREAVAEVVALVPPLRIAMRGRSGGYEIDAALAVAPRGAAKSRVTVRAEVRAAGLRAKLSAPAVRLLDGRIEAALRSALRAAKDRLES